MTERFKKGYEVSYEGDAWFFCDYYSDRVYKDDMEFAYISKYSDCTECKKMVNAARLTLLSRGKTNNFNDLYDLLKGN